MRLNSTNFLGLSVLVLLGGIILASFASAQTAAVTGTQSPHAEVIQQLKQAHALLVHADYDYDGHRAKAAEEVHKALVDLGYHHKKTASASTVTNGTVAKAPGTATVHTGQPKMHESQGSSDAQLRQALQILQGSLTALNNGKHSKAHANINAAIAHINTALSVK